MEGVASVVETKGHALTKKLRGSAAPSPKSNAHTYEYCKNPLDAGNQSTISLFFG